VGTLELATLVVALLTAGAVTVVVIVALLNAVVVITEVTVAVVAEVVETVSWLGGTITVNVVDAASPPGLAPAVTMYEPAPTSAIMKFALNVPLEIEQVGALTGLPDSEQAVSAVEKPEPDT
jgi:hypothetical protein